jgi:hypothetical protein
MAEHERTSQKTQEKVEQKHRIRQQESEPVIDHFHAWEQGTLSIGETPFLPRMDEHAELISRIPFAKQRHDFILQLQQTYGNRYVQRLIESMKVQGKLNVSSPNDIYEQEADRVAKAVTRATKTEVQPQTEEEEEEETEEEEIQTMPASQAQRQEEETEEEEPEEEEEEPVQAKIQLAVEEEEELQGKPAGSQPATVSEELEGRIKAERGGGHPLTETVREPMERAFEADFSGVRVHTDAEADTLNQQLSARAFTTGQDVFFRENEYSPGSDSGRELIAHELTHVVQQRGSPLMHTPSSTKLQRIWNPFKRKKKPRVSAPTGVKKTTSASQIMQVIFAADHRALAAMSKNRRFLAQMEASLSQEEYDKASIRIEMGTKLWVWTMLKAIKGGQLISINQWVLLKQVASEEDYKTAIKEFDSFSGDAAEKEKFLKSIPNDKLYIFSDIIPKWEKKPQDKPLEEQIKTSANPKRAETALRELKAKQAIDEKSKSRLTDTIIELLVWGVAKPRAAGDIGSEGIIGIDHAVNAAGALIAMTLPAYLDIVMKLALTGGEKKGWDQRQVESVLILKAVAARKSKYQADEAKAKTEVGTFAGEIRGEDLEKLTKGTSTRGIGGGEGLQQRFTMSCGPTSIQIIRGEADPVYALDITKAGKHTTEYKSKVAEEQRTIMGKPLIPREVMDSWEQFKATINGLVFDPADVPKWQHLLNFITGQAYDFTILNQGAALANAIGFNNDRLTEFSQYFPFDQPGLSADEVFQRLQTELTGVVGAGKKYEFAGGVTDAHLNDVWKALFRGRDVGIGVLWPPPGGGGHIMVLSDCKGTPPTGGAGRSFLLSDPWKGTSEWLTNAQILGGQLGSHGQGTVALTMFKPVRRFIPKVIKR